MTDTVFSLVLAATVVASLKVLGVTMIAAAIVIPPIIARLLTDRFRTMMLISVVICGAFCGFGGVYVSWILDISSGASVVLFSSLLFLLTLIYSNLKGWLPSGLVGRASLATDFPGPRGCPGLTEGAGYPWSRLEAIAGFAVAPFVTRGGEVLLHTS